LFYKYLIISLLFCSETLVILLLNFLQGLCCIIIPNKDKYGLMLMAAMYAPARNLLFVQSLFGLLTLTDLL